MPANQGVTATPDHSYFVGPDNTSFPTSTNQTSLKRIVLNTIGDGSVSNKIKGQTSLTSNALYVPWKKGDSNDNGFISKYNLSGELQWRNQIADVNQITTATDEDENLYIAWSRNSDFTKETRGSFIAKLNPDNGEILWKTQLESFNYIIKDLHAVGDTLYGAVSYTHLTLPTTTIV